MEETKHVEEFFTYSNTEDKPWRRRDLGDGNYQVTKVGSRCEACREHFGKLDPVFRSVRVEYQTFIDKDGKKRREFSWINAKCSCATLVLYKDGEFLLKSQPWFMGTKEWEKQVMVAEPYDKRARQVDDLRRIPSNIEIKLGAD